jgi:hypothetical protein
MEVTAIKVVTDENNGNELAEIATRETLTLIGEMVQSLMEDLDDALIEEPRLSLQTQGKLGRRLIVPDFKTFCIRLQKYFVPFPIPPTRNALAGYLGYADDKSLADMVKRENEFSPWLKRALGIIRVYWEAALIKGQCAGPIFWLKQCGWTDRTDITTDGESLTPQVVEYRNIPKPVTSTELAQAQAQEQKALPEGSHQAADDTEPGIQ